MRPILALLALLPLACAPEEGTTSVNEAVSAAAPSASADSDPIEVARQVRDLVTALTPPPATSNSAVQREFVNRRRDVLRTAKAGSPALGHAVRRELEEHPEHIRDVRRGLLEVAAHTIPTEMEPVLVQLVTEFGEDLGLRTKAAELLGATHPAKAVEVLGPLIRDPRPGLTLPPGDILVSTFADAAQAADIDVLDALTEIATNLFIDESARLSAVRGVAKYSGPRARAAIRILVIESTGNGYLRRQAVFALIEHSKVDPETAAELCPMLTEICDKETDLNFLEFMLNVLDKHCQ